MRKHSGLFVILFLFIAAGAFCGPFGFDFGMSLEQVKRISRTTPENIGDDRYVITPLDTHELFEVYVMRIHPAYGIYFIKATSRNISTNGHGTELIEHFNNLASNMEISYGKYLRIDRLNPESLFPGSQNFMHALSKGDRELAVFWRRSEGSRLPEDILEIIVYAEARTSSIGNIVVEYYSMNYEKVEE